MRGFWMRERDILFLLRIEPADYERMPLDVAHTLRPERESEASWEVASTAVLLKPGPVLRIEKAIWSSESELPPGKLLLRVGRDVDFPAHKAFTQQADLQFRLEAEGHLAVHASASVGGIAGKGKSFVVLHPHAGTWDGLYPEVDYRLVPSNRDPAHRWQIPASVTVRR